MQLKHLVFFSVFGWGDTEVGTKETAEVKLIAKSIFFRNTSERKFGLFQVSCRRLQYLIALIFSDGNAYLFFEVCAQDSGGNVKFFGKIRNRQV